MKYKCLIFDHDDTTVNSTASIHYPSFVEFMKIYRPEIHYTLDEYVLYNFDPGVMGFFRDMCGLSEEELILEQEFWREFSSHHLSDAFDGIREIMERQKEEGGKIVVVSHSFEQHIMDEYKHNNLPMPDRIFGWDQPREERKPAPHPVLAVMKEYGLKPEEVLVIDDLKPGLDMARAAGVPFAAAGWCFDVPQNTRYMQENADFWFSSVEELAEHLK